MHDSLNLEPILCCCFRYNTMNLTRQSIKKHLAQRESESCNVPIINAILHNPTRTHEFRAPLRIGLTSRTKR